MKWIVTDEVTIESARELLAKRIAPDIPIYLRWHRRDTSQPWGGTYHCTVTLEGVTAKRIKVREIAGGTFYVPPDRLRAAVRRQA